MRKTSGLLRGIRAFQMQMRLREIKRPSCMKEDEISSPSPFIGTGGKSGLQK